MNSPFGMVPSNEQSSGIDLHVDNSNEHISQKSEHGSLSDLNEMSDFDIGVEGELADHGQKGESVYSVEDEDEDEVYMSVNQDGEVESTENFVKFNKGNDGQDIERGNVGDYVDISSQESKDSKKVDLGEREVEVRREGQIERKEEMKDKGKGEIETERKTRIEAETDSRISEGEKLESQQVNQTERDAETSQNKKSQDKSKTTGVGSLGRSKRASEEAISSKVIRDESKKMEESKVSGNSEAYSDKVNIKVEAAQNRKHNDTNSTPTKDSIKKDAIQNSSNITSVANSSIITAVTNDSISNSVGNTSESISSFNISNSQTEVQTNTDNKKTLALEKGISKNTKDALEGTEVGGDIVSGKNTTGTLNPSSNVKSKQKSLKKATHSSARDKSRKKSSKTEEATLKKVSKESSKGEGLESTKPGRLGSSRGDLSKLSNSENIKQDKDFKPLSKKEEGFKADFEDRFRCLNINMSIFESLSILDPLSLTCSPNLELQKLKSIGDKTEKVKQVQQSKEQKKILKKPGTNMESLYNPIWRQVFNDMEKTCGKSENSDEFKSEKVPIEDIQIYQNNTATTSTTTTVSILTTTEALPKTVEKPVTRTLATVEKEKDSKNDPVPLKSHDSRRERSRKKSKGGMNWIKVLQRMEILNVADKYIQGAARRMLKFNTYIYKLYTDRYKRRVLRRAQEILGHFHIVNRAQVNRDQHFLGAYTLLGSILASILVLFIIRLHGRLINGSSQVGLEEAETIKKLGLVGGKIKMLSSHISISDKGIENVVFSDDPNSICQKILESKSIVSKSPRNNDYSQDKTDTKDSISILNLISRLEENNEILQHLSNGLTKCAQSLRI